LKAAKIRSPWSNKYEPAIEDGFLPSEKLRSMEIEFNELFDAYRELYFEGGTSSVYLWDLDHGFAACFLIKKSKTKFSPAVHNVNHSCFY
jgi:capping protein beta